MRFLIVKTSSLPHSALWVQIFPLTTVFSKYSVHHLMYETVFHVKQHTHTHTHTHKHAEFQILWEKSRIQKCLGWIVTWFSCFISHWIEFELSIIIIELSWRWITFGLFRFHLRFLRGYSRIFFQLYFF